jgi:serine/threonine-protein kinase
LCPTCLLRQATGATPRPDESPRTPDPNETGLHQPEATNATTADLAQQPDTTGLQPSSSAKSAGLNAQSRHVPAALGNLDVVEEIGHGGMGVVYRAKQRFANREVAVKVLSAALATRGGAAERFSGEIEALAKLRHPNIVEVYEVGEDSGCVYFSMELVPGGTLAGRAKREPLAPAEAAAIVEQLAEAVDAAHKLGLVHRDIKPANVLLAADGSPKLSDFGLAKWMDREDGLTETGAVLGTPSYMAPEQAVGSKRGTLGPPADVYGLGATLYELLTGRPPFRAASTFETLQKVIHELPVAPRALCPAVHADLEAVCLKCLEKDPARRYATAEELANDLHRWRIGDPTRARPPSWPRKVWRAVRRRSRWIGAVATLAVAVAIGVYIAIQLAPKPIAPPAPEDPAEEVMKALRDGKKVTLIGETGAPRYQRWALGVGEAKKQDVGDLFMAFTAGSGFVELVPDTQTERFRFTAEYRVDASIESDSFVGIYFAHHRSVLGGGMTTDRALLARFGDDLKNNKRSFSERGVPNAFDLVSLSDHLFYTPATGLLNSTSVPLGSLRVEDPLDPISKTKKRELIPWRQIVATVGPDEILVEWRDPDGSYRPVGIEGLRPRPKIPTSSMKSRDKEYREFVTKLYPEGNSGALAPYNSRGGAGLYVRNARVFFRNVIVEPLP